MWLYQEVERSVQSTFFAPGKIIIDWRWKTWGCFTKTQEHLFCKFHNVPLPEKRRLIEAFQDAVSYRKHHHQLLNVSTFQKSSMMVSFWWNGVSVMMVCYSKKVKSNLIQAPINTLKINFQCRTRKFQCDHARGTNETSLCQNERSTENLLMKILGKIVKERTTRKRLNISQVNLLKGTIKN